jgi:hypothetical protein
MTKTRIRIGDIYAVKIDDGFVRYFQYVTRDLTQLNSDVIIAFKKRYSINECPDLTEILNDDVDFYAHCIIKWGVKLGFWEKYGNVKALKEHKMLFRDSGDDLRTEISSNWWIWTINNEQQHVGVLSDEMKHAEIGSVISPKSIVYRLKNGNYNFVYPALE